MRGSGFEDHSFADLSYDLLPVTRILVVKFAQLASRGATIED